MANKLDDVLLFLQLKYLVSCYLQEAFSLLFAPCNVLYLFFCLCACRFVCQVFFKYLCGLLPYLSVMLTVFFVIVIHKQQTHFCSCVQD